MKRNRVRSEVISRARLLLESLGLDMEDPNFIDTPGRVAQWLLDFTLTDSYIKKECAVISKAMFPSKDDDMVIVKPFVVYSMCPHHLLPVEYKVSIGYIPNGHVIGISKLVRLANMVARQPILQEDYAPRLADVLCKSLDTKHVAIRTEGVHSCMRIRGVRTYAPIVKSTMRGDFRDDSSSVKQEFNSILNGR